MKYKIKKDISDIKSRISKIESTLNIKINKKKEVKVDCWLWQFVLAIFIWWWVNIIVYAIAGFYKTFKVIFIPKREKIKMKEHHIKNEFNECSYFWNRFLDKP